MYTRKRFSIKEMALWTRKETYTFIIIAIVEVLLFHFSGGLLSLPFTPVALLGTAVAFVIGFQSNAAYNRTWEARKIWGAIVNSSRTFGTMIQDFVSDTHSHEKPSDEELYHEKKELIHRHIAWLTALRYAMRAPKPWEYVLQEKTNQEWSQMIFTPEFITSYEDAMSMYLTPEDTEYLRTKNNKPTALLYLQSEHLTRLKDRKLIWEFSYLELENVIEELYTHQGKSERIKNFPYPRQYASLLHYFTWLFILVIPIAMVGQFQKTAIELSSRFPQILDWFYLMSLPFSIMIMWVFHTMNRIGQVGENPFEGTANDVPISAIARTIEIDLRQNLGEKPADIPTSFPVHHHTQM